MEMIGKGKGERGAVWVALRLPDGTVGAHANQARIGTWPRDHAVAMWSDDIVSFAKAKGLYPSASADEDFSFSAVFDPLTPLSARTCEARVWDLFRSVAGSSFGAHYLDYVQGTNLSNRMPLFIRPASPLSLNHTMWAMRQHYEDSWFDSRADLGAGPYASPYCARPIVDIS